MTKFIADVCSNHNQDINRAKELIIAAKDAGCYAVKFQLFKGEKLYAPEFPVRVEAAKKQELPLDFIPKIYAICQDVGIEFHCTPFDIESVKILDPFVNQFKIGSYEILYLKLIEACANTGKPLGISFGNYNLIEEINRALIALSHTMDLMDLTIYHCVSKYPAKAEDCNMHDILMFLNKYYTGSIGWSDHTVQSGVIFAAIKEGAEFIEFHLDLEDGKGSEYHHGHCWKPSQIKQVIYDVIIMEKAFNHISINFTEINKWRTDPEDGMRPLQQYRKELSND